MSRLFELEVVDDDLVVEGVGALHAELLAGGLERAERRRRIRHLTRRVHVAYRKREAVCVAVVLSAGRLSNKPQLPPRNVLNVTRSMPLVRLKANFSCLFASMYLSQVFELRFDLLRETSTTNPNHTGEFA